VAYEGEGFADRHRYIRTEALGRGLVSMCEIATDVHAGQLSATRYPRRDDLDSVRPWVILRSRAAVLDRSGSS